MLAALPSLPRTELSRLTDRLIERMDEIDGDPDYEANGDEYDGGMGEDDFHEQQGNRLGFAGDTDDGEDPGNHDLEHGDV